MANFLKSISSLVNTKQDINSFVNASTTGLTYTLCDRTDLSDKNSNYFVSFNLPHRQSIFGTGHTLSIEKPELQQLNVDKIIIGNIDGSYYSKIIDGRSITFSCPQISGTSYSAKTIISSTYTTLEKSQSNELLGDNIAFLFCDEINKPYSGVTVSYGFSVSYPSRANVLSWSASTSYVNRPVAVSFTDVHHVDVATSKINTDTRLFSSVNLAVPVPQNYPDTILGGTPNLNGYNYDIPVGFVALDKGFVVLTHPLIVNNFPWTAGTKSDNSPNTGPTSSTTTIHFSDITKSNASFVGIETQYTTSALCLIMPGEFYTSTNPTWDQLDFNQEKSSGDNNFESIYISELAIHNTLGEVIAYAKLDSPIRKNYSDFLSFVVDLKI